MEAITVKLDLVPLGRFCAMTGKKPEKMPRDWKVPGHMHVHNHAPCSGTVKSYTRPMRVSEQIIAVVEFRSLQVECPECKAAPKANCTFPNGKKMIVTHSARMVAAQHIKVKVV